MKTNLTKAEKAIVRSYVSARYAHRGGRNVRIMSNGDVHVTVDGDGTQVVNGRDRTAGVIFAGLDTVLLREARAEGQQ